MFETWNKIFAASKTFIAGSASANSHMAPLQSKKPHSMKGLQKMGPSSQPLLRTDFKTLAINQFHVYQSVNAINYESWRTEQKEVAHFGQEEFVVLSVTGRRRNQLRYHSADEMSQHCARGAGERTSRINVCRALCSTSWKTLCSVRKTRCRGSERSSCLSMCNHYDLQIYTTRPK